MSDIPMFGFCGGGLQKRSLTPEFVAACKSIGLGDICRFNIWIERAWRDPSKPIDWEQSDWEFEVLEKHGVVPYPNFFGAPGWMSDNKPAYREGLNGCWEYNDPNDPPDLNKNFHVAGKCEPLCWRCAKKPERVDYCFTNVPHLNINALAEFAGAFAERYKDRFKYVAAGNELTSGGGLFWPPSGIENGRKMDDALLRFANEYWYPIMGAIGAVDPSVKHVGPEADGGDGLRRIITDVKLPLDIISLHPYTGVFDIEMAMNYCYVYGGGRDVWCTEQDPSGGWLLRTARAYPWIKAYTFYYVAERLLDKQMKPNIEGLYMRGVIDALKGIGEPTNAPRDEQATAAGLTALRMWAIDRMKDLPDRGIDDHLMPGSQVAYHLSTYGAVPPSVSNPVIKKVVERIDARFKRPLLGDVKMLPHCVRCGLTAAEAQTCRLATTTDATHKFE